jgi:hypothetical protein
VYRVAAGWTIYPNPDAGERQCHIGLDNSSVATLFDSGFSMSGRYFGTEDGDSYRQFNPNKSGVRVLGCALDMDKTPPECVWFIRETGAKEEFEESKYRRTIDAKFAETTLGVRPAVSMEDVSNDNPRTPMQVVGDSVPSFLVDLGYVGIASLVEQIFSEEDADASGDAPDDSTGGADEAYDGSSVEVRGWSGKIRVERPASFPSLVDAKTDSLNPSFGPAHAFVPSGRWCVIVLP